MTYQEKLRKNAEALLAKAENAEVGDVWENDTHIITRIS